MPTLIPSVGTRLFVRTAAGTDLELETITSITGLDGERNEKEITTLKDTAERVSLGIKRYGTVTVEAFHAEGDAGLDEVYAAYMDGVDRLFTWVLPAGRALQFMAFAKNFPYANGGIDNDYKATLKLRVNNDVTVLASFTPSP